MNAPSIGIAELLLITDCTVSDEHFPWILKLAGRGIEREQVTLVDSGRTCTWPLELEVPSYTSIDSVGSHVWHLAGYLSQNRETVHAIQNLGCNLQLNVHGVALNAPLTLPASTLQQLGELYIQLQLIP
ncbi:MAG TPA: hypothetical protein DDW52_29390 [Planctomycetaceae bacterium]|nr:hypothetical protein [Planctomycetaceae bacterium]